MTPKSKLASLLALIALVVSGCVGNMTYPTIEPTSYKPSGMAPAAAVEVDSLTPTFSWKQPPEDVMARMDLAVWEVNPDGSPGETYYSERGFIGNQHTMTKPLEPGVEYFWSVKRSDSFQWAKANYVGVSPLGAAWQNGVPFKIKAPATRIVPAQSVTSVPIAAPAAIQVQTEQVSGDSVYAPFESQIGGVWVCQLPPDRDGTLNHQENVFTWSDNKEGVKGDLWLFKGDKRISHTQELIVWNAAERKFLLTGTDTEGNLKQSVITMEGEVEVSDVTFTKKDGTELKLHARTRLLSADVILSEIYHWASGGWVKAQDLVFERHHS